MHQQLLHSTRTRDLLRAGFVACVVFAFFMAVALMAQMYDQELRDLMGKSGVWGPLLYVLITIVAVVCAPVSSLPLLPIASALWGFIAAALLSITGWVVGAQVAFWLARRFGKSLVGKLVPLEKLTQWENAVPTRRLFVAVVLLRLTVPVDVLSYALGLFSRMSAWAYFFATLIGVTPFAFVFAYTGTRSPLVQVHLLVAVGLSVFALALVRPYLLGSRQ